MLIAILLLTINGAIAYWNARVCGMIWTESRAVGGWIRLVVWSAAIQSAIGFSMVYMAVLGYGAYALGKLDPTMINFMVSLWWLAVVVPLVGTSWIILIHSWMEWWRDRSLLNLSVSAWNTYATLHNTYSAFSGFGDAMKGITEAFDAEDIKGFAIVAVILMVVIALAGGIFTTACLIKKYAGTVPLPNRSKIPV